MITAKVLWGLELTGLWNQFYAPDQTLTASILLIPTLTNIWKSHLMVDFASEIFDLWNIWFLRFPNH